MFDYFSWSVALRNLRYHSGQNMLSLGVVAINITLMIFLSALIGGLQRRLIASVTGAIPHISVRSSPRLPQTVWQTSPAADKVYAGKLVKLQQQERKIEDWRLWVSRMPSYDRSILAVSPVVEDQAILTRESKRMAVVVSGVLPEQHNEVVDIQSKLVAGRFFGLNAGDAAIGYKLAEEFSLQIGDKIRLVNARGYTVTYNIAGIFDSGFKNVDAGMVFLTLHDAQSLFGLGSAVTSIGVKLRDIFAAERLAKRLSLQLPYEVTSWMQDNQSLLSGLNAQSQSSRLILCFTTIASGFGIASIMIMLVMSKLKEIGILKAMGAKKKQVVRVFTIQGTLLSILGGMVGVGIGVSLCSFLRRFRTTSASGRETDLFPVEFDWQMMAFAIAVAALVGFIASLYPAWRAARVNAIEVIRGA